MLLSEMNKQQKARGGKPVKYVKSFMAGSHSRLFADWLSSTLAADDEIKGDLVAIRARARDLEANEPLARKYLSMCVNNIIGPDGIKLQANVLTTKGKPDLAANRKIEAGWYDFLRPEHFSSCGKMSGKAMSRLLVRTMARDGEAFVQIIKSKKYKYGFVIHPIDPDQIDHEVHGILKNGNEAHLGIEQDRFGRPLFYHVKERSISSTMGGLLANDSKTRRIPAKDIIHLFIKRRPGSSRDVSWMVAGMPTIKMMNGFREAALVNARVSASKVGFYLTNTGNEYQGDDEDGQGNIISEAEPGLFEELPRNVTDFKVFDPKQPSGEFDPFMKSNGRSVASAWEVSYHALTNDLTDVSFSSIRSGTLEERDSWMNKQDEVIEQYWQPVYELWLKMAMLTGALKLNMADFYRFITPIWQAKRWQWVDPKNDSVANENAIKNFSKSYSDVASEQGKVFENVIARRAIEKQMIKEAGLQGEGDYEN